MTPCASMATASSPETTLPAGADPAPADARHYRMPTRPVRRGITIAAAAVGAAAAALATGPGQLPGPAALAVAAIALQVPLGAPIAATDLRHHRIPNWLVLALAAGTLAALAVHPGLLLPGLAAAAGPGGRLGLIWARGRDVQGCPADERLGWRAVRADCPGMFLISWLV